MTRWLVVGAGGQLGTDLCAILRPDDSADAVSPDTSPDDGPDDVTGLTRAELDVTDAAAVAGAVDAVRPDVIVNASAYNAVDAAETDEASAFAVNAHAPEILAKAATARGARFVHVSTDYVFAGDASAPYDEATATAPRSAYGRSKAAGEQAVLAVAPEAYVVRTAWVYGVNGRNFVKTMARLERERETVSVVDDQRGSPTWSHDLAAGLIALVRANAPGGIYHCTNSGDTTWYGFTKAIFEELGADPARVLPTTTDKFPRPAPRPAYSVLGNRRWREAGLPALRPWREALHAAFAAVGDQLSAQD